MFKFFSKNCSRFDTIFLTLGLLVIDCVTGNAQANIEDLSIEADTFSSETLEMRNIDEEDELWSEVERLALLISYDVKVININDNNIRTDDIGTSINNDNLY